MSTVYRPKMCDRCIIASSKVTCDNGDECTGAACLGGHYCDTCRAKQVDER